MKVFCQFYRLLDNCDNFCNELIGDSGLAKVSDQYKKSSVYNLRKAFFSIHAIRNLVPKDLTGLHESLMGSGIVHAWVMMESGEVETCQVWMMLIYYLHERPVF